MKIGILTFHAPCNFGANLQAYASTCLFRKLGHDVVVFNFIRETETTYKKVIPPIQWEAHNIFVNHNLPLTRPLYNLDELKAEILAQGTEMVLIGADAVWRAPHSERDMAFYAPWLLDKSFSHVRVASLSAAHMGNGYADVSAKNKEIIRQSLEKFSLISVRDEWTREKINLEIMGSDRVKIVNPDPVVLLSDFLAEHKVSFPEHIEAGNYIVMTLPLNWLNRHSKKRQSWLKSFKQLVNEAGYQLVELPLPEGASGAQFDYSVPFPLSPKDWFAWLRGARAFCGLRFHSLVSCISAGTPFFSIDVYGHSSRFYTAMSRLGFYRIARARDHRSKIRNLLAGSGFENYRVHAEIESIPAKTVFDLLMASKPEEILRFRDQLRSIFTETAEQIVK